MSILTSIMSMDTACSIKTGMNIPEEVLRIIYQYIKTNNNNYKIEKLFHINNKTIEDHIKYFSVFNVKELKHIKKEAGIKSYSYPGTGKNFSYNKEDHIVNLAVAVYGKELTNKLNILKDDNICLKYYKKNKPYGKKIL